MADGRRTRWVAHDVYFLDDGLGSAMFDRFGAAGIALWHGFIAACKKNHVEGEVSWASDAEALLIFGLPGMPLVDSAGEPFALNDWLDLLSDHKVIRRTSRARRLKVACTRWKRWQQAARRSRKAEQKRARRDGTDEQNRRSDPENTDRMQARYRHDAGEKQAQMTDTDTDTDRDREKPFSSDVPSDPEFPEQVHTLTRHLAQRVKANGFKIPDKGTKAVTRWLDAIDKLLRIDHAQPDEVARVIDWATSDEFWQANIRSAPKFREQYPALRLRMLNSSRASPAKRTGAALSTAYHAIADELQARGQ